MTALLGGCCKSAQTPIPVLTRQTQESKGQRLCDLTKAESFECHFVVINVLSGARVQKKELGKCKLEEPLAVTGGPRAWGHFLV